MNKNIVLVLMLLIVNSLFAQKVDCKGFFKGDFYGEAIEFLSEQEQTDEYENFNTGDYRLSFACEKIAQSDFLNIYRFNVKSSHPAYYLVFINGNNDYEFIENYSLDSMIKKLLNIFSHNNVGVDTQSQILLKTIRFLEFREKEIMTNSIPIKDEGE